MSEANPSVYILNGEDEYAIHQTVAEFQASLGDAAIAEMNTTRLDGNSYNPDQLMTIAGALPFLARRRLVIFTNPLAKFLNSEPARQKFRQTLENLPPTTALVLVEYRLLTQPKDVGDPKKHHWLHKWADEHPGLALYKTYPAPKGVELNHRIQKMAAAAKGQIDTDAADMLAELVDDNPRQAAQEIDKLLAYVNYRRPITLEDVLAVTADSNQGDVFKLVDELARRNGRAALAELKRLAEYNEYYGLFGMIVRQFRFLIQARDVLDRGGGLNEIKRIDEVRFDFIARRLLEQAQRFRTAELEEAYHRLIEVDRAVKSSLVSDDLALEFFVSAFTTAPDQHLVFEN